MAALRSVIGTGTAASTTTAAIFQDAAGRRAGQFQRSRRAGERHRAPLGDDELRRDVAALLPTHGTFPGRTWRSATPIYREVARRGPPSTASPLTAPPRIEVPAS